MKKLEYDCVIIGAGPGGSTTAKYAAMRGVNVLMLDKRQEIGCPVRCGEGIAKIWLNEVGIEPDPKWISHEVDGARVISPDGSIVTMNERVAGNECGYVVRREIFDKELVKDAVRHGAKIMVKCLAESLIIEDGKVKGVRARRMGEEYEIRCNVVVGADGFESKVGRWAGLKTQLKKKDLNVCCQYLMVGVDIDPRYNDFYIGSEVAPGGYIWVFPKGQDEANVGIGVNLSKISGKASAKRYLDEFIKKQEGLAKGKAVEISGGAISCCMPLDKTTTDGVLLVGDAARMIDSLTGGGVSLACQSGKVAGEVIARAIEAGDFSNEFLMAYDRGWREVMEEQLIRNFIAKEKLVTLSDDTLNKLISALSDVDIEKVTTYNILKAVESKHPELVEELADLL